MLRLVSKSHIAIEESAPPDRRLLKLAQLLFMSSENSLSALKLVNCDGINSRGVRWII